MAALVFLLGVVVLVSRTSAPMQQGDFGGLSARAWLIMALAVPVLHQGYVWLVWRLELHTGKITDWLGEKGFTIYALGFSLLFAARFLTILGLAVANRNTLAVPPWLGLAVGGLLLAPTLYLLFSLHRYFGWQRAYGIDHFVSAYRFQPLVREGIFRYTANGMYVFGFLLFWIPGWVLRSQAALLAALFSHLYIWVHYYCTEKPDMQFIYRS